MLLSKAKVIIEWSLKNKIKHFWKFSDHIFYVAPSFWSYVVASQINTLKIIWTMWCIRYLTCAQNVEIRIKLVKSFGLNFCTITDWRHTNWNVSGRLYITIIEVISIYRFDRSLDVWRELLHLYTSKVLYRYGLR